jgi:hypothetical protein
VIFVPVVRNRLPSGGHYVQASNCPKPCCFFLPDDPRSVGPVKECPHFVKLWAKFNVDADGIQGLKGFIVDCADNVEEAVALRLMED